MIHKAPKSQKIRAQ